jgi:DNA-binding FrmR family transcriptional regulator
MPMHQTHPAIAKRLRRANGHLERIIEMLAEGRSCMELAQQLQAVERAVNSAKKTLIHDHLDRCLQESVGGRKNHQSRALVGEFREVAKYL